MSIDRWASSAPRTLAGAARLVTRSAIDNARRAAEQLGFVVAERRVLEQLMAAPEPGDLTRLTPAECGELLLTRSVGRLAYVARAGVPDIVPVNYVMDGDAVLLRSGPGPKLQAAERGDVVAFEVDDIDELTHTGWSVVLVGRASLVPPDQSIAAAAGPPWANGPRRHTMRIAPRRIDGRRLL